MSGERSSTRDRNRIWQQPDTRTVADTIGSQLPPPCLMLLLAPRRSYHDEECHARAELINKGKHERRPLLQSVPSEGGRMRRSARQLSCLLACWVFGNDRAPSRLSCCPRRGQSVERSPR